MEIREYRKEELDSITEIWNEVVEDGIAFPQTEKLTRASAGEFFAAQSFTGVAVEGGRAVGLYILHPNNIGRCGHIANASFAVKGSERGKHIGEKLVLDCIDRARELGFGLIQFNAVVESNVHARHLYERLGFKPIGTVPKGFRMKDGHLENICLYYYEL